MRLTCINTRAAANTAIEQEIKALKENALKKEAEAVDLVISKLV